MMRSKPSRESILIGVVVFLVTLAWLHCLVLLLAAGPCSAQSTDLPLPHWLERADSLSAARTAEADSAPVPLVQSLIREGTEIAGRAITLTETDDITAEQFWRRQPLGFDRQALSHLWSLVVNLPGRVPEITAGIRDNAGPLTLFTVLTLLALILSYILQRQVSVRIAREVGQSLHPLRIRLPNLVSRLIVSVVRFSTAVLAPIAILGIFHLVRKTTGLDAPWFRGVGDFLLGWTILAAALGILHEVLLGGLLTISKEHGRCLFNDFRRTALIGFLGLVTVALAQRAGAPETVLTLGRFLVKLGVLLSAALGLRRRDAVLDLFPPFENRAYQAFLRWLRRFYGPAIFFTFIVLLAGMIGYGQLAAFLLVRSWVLVAIFVATVGLHSGVLALLRYWIVREKPVADEAREFYGSVVHLVTYVTAIAIGTLFLQILGVLSPITRLLSAEIGSVGDQTINALLFIKAIAVVLIFVFLGRLICKYLDFQVYPALNADPGVSTAINTMLTWLLVGLGTIISLNTVGLNLRVLTLLAGALGIGIGFGLQGFANNMVSGLTLIFGRNLRRGDFVTVGGNDGFVQAVGVRVTRIRTRDHIEYTVPNSTFLDNMIINWSHTSPMVRTHVPIGVSYRADPEDVQRVLLEVAAENRLVESSPPPKLWFIGYGDSSIDFELLVWTNVRRVSQQEVTSQILYAAFAALKREGIEIPFPQRDLHIRSGLHAALPGRPGTAPEPPAPTITEDPT